MGLACDECRKGSDEVPLAIKGIVYTGSPKEYVVISVLCQKCDTGEIGEQAKAKLDFELAGQ